MSDVIGGMPGEFVYGFRPRMIGSGYAFRLGEHSLEYNISGLAGQTPYPMIAMVRLGYRPSNFSGRRFTAEIWPRSGSKIEIASTSYTSMVAMDDQGPAYRAFITELHRRIAKSGAECRFEAGFAAWRWWPMLVISAAAAAALVYTLVTTLLNGDFTASLLILGFMGLFGWQMGPLVVRNRPMRYEPLHIPEHVLP